MDPIVTKRRDFSVDDSPEVIRRMIGELERQISDTAEEESAASRRLGDVEEEMIKRKEAELEKNVLRAEIERELLGATKERLKEIEEEERNALERLEAEQAALFAKRRNAEVEIENMEKTLAERGQELDRKSKSIQNQIDSAPEYLKNRFFEEISSAPEPEVTYQPSSEWDPNTLLEAWLTGDPNGIFSQRQTTPIATTNRLTPSVVSKQKERPESGSSLSSARTATTNDGEVAAETVAAQISRLRNKLVKNGDAKCAAALRSLIEAERALAENKSDGIAEPLKETKSTNTLPSAGHEPHFHHQSHSQEPLPPTILSQTNPPAQFCHQDPFSWQHQQQQQLQFMQQQQLQFMQQQQQQQIERMIYQQTQAREAEERAKLKSENRRLRSQLGAPPFISDRPDERQRATPSPQGASLLPTSKEQSDDDDDDIREQRREIAALELEMEKFRRVEQLKSLKDNIEREQEEEQQKREHDYWLESQRRRVQALRVDKALAAQEKESGVVDPFMPEVFESYEPSKGFGVRFDFVFGASGAERDQVGKPRIQKLRIVYAIHDDEVAGRPRSTDWVPYSDATTQGQRTGVAIFALGGAEGNATFSRLKPSGRVRLVLEIQADTGNGETRKKRRNIECAGWAAIPIFTDGLVPRSIDDDSLVPTTSLSTDKHYTLAAGAWKVPIVPGSFSKEAIWPPAIIPASSLMLHTRIYFSNAPPAMSAIDPFSYFQRYHQWGSQLSFIRDNVPQMADKEARKKNVKVHVYTANIEGISDANFVAISAHHESKQVWKSSIAKIDAGRMTSWPRDNTFEMSTVIAPCSVSFALYSGDEVVPKCSGFLEVINDAGGVRYGDATVSLSDGNGGVRLAQLHVSIECDEQASSIQAKSEPAPPPKMVEEASPSQSADLPGGIDFLEKRREDPTGPFRSGQGVDIFVDGARGLPDNAGASKVTVKLLSQGEVVGDEHSVVALVDGKRFSPSYDLIFELRNQNVDPTSTLMFRVDALDEDAPSPESDPPLSKRKSQESQPKVVGYALLNLFCSSGDVTKQPTDRHAQKYCLVSGGYQLPLYRAKPKLTAALRADSLARSPRVAGATLLVRIQSARTTRSDSGVTETLSRVGIPRSEWAAKNLDAPTPSYASGAYDSSFCMPMSSVERELYKRRRTRQDTGLMKSGLAAELADVNAALQAKPTVLLSHFRASAYESDLGFAIAVDGLNHMPPDAFYKVVTIVSPPGLYFRKPSVADDAQFTIDHDLDATLDAPRYKDPPRRFTEKPRNASLSAIFEVKALHVIHDKRTGCVVDVSSDDSRCYWTALPVFQKQTKAHLNSAAYVDSGAFLLPLFRGSVPPAVLAAPDIWDCILDNLDRTWQGKKKKKKDRTSSMVDLAGEGQSLVVRLVDAQVEDLQTFTKPTRKEYAVNAAVAADVEPSAYSFNYNAGPSGTRKPLRKLVPKKLTDDVLHRELTRTFCHATGIRRYLER